VFQWVTDLFNRLPVQTNGNCMTGSARPKFVISAWTFYLTAMLYDCLTLSISTYFLLKLKVSAVSTTTKLLRILLYDGLGYLVALTAVNLMNIILYRRAAKSIQSSGASLEYAVTWIMSQRILIHLREARAKQSSVIMSHPQTGHTAMSGLRFDGETKHDNNGDLTTDYRGAASEYPSEFDVEVRIDRSIFRDTAKPADGAGQTGSSRDLFVSPRVPAAWDRTQAHRV